MRNDKLSVQSIDFAVSICFPQYRQGELEMKKILKTVLEILFLFHRFRLQTKLTKEEILKRVERFVIESKSDYDGWGKNDGFTIVEKPFKSFMLFGGFRNSFAPVAVAKIVEAHGVTTVSCLLRMNIIIQILMVPIYLSMFFYVFMAPVSLIFLVLLHCAFFHPAKRLKKALINILTEN